MQKAANDISQGNLTSRVVVRGDDELAAMARDINNMAESLAKLDSSRRRWLAEISHELRTPLSVLVGELDALKDDVRPLNMGAIQSLSDEAERMARIVNDLHVLAISDLPGTFCKFAPCDAAVIIKRAHARFSMSFEAADIELNVDDEISALPVVWDEPRISQILANILTNSLRYTNGPGRVMITLGTTGNDVLIQVNDSAPSVCEGQFDRLFEPLYRAESARDHVNGGSGLGLAVSEAIVKAHKGKISIAKSALGGLCLNVILPRDPGQA
jgi:two-component system, OmpR family, sensor histidine kinase BaeS